MKHPNIQHLVDCLQERVAALPAGQQYWLGIAGAPGAGKSWLSGRLQRAMGDAGVVIPMDGYHFARQELDAMPDPAEAHRRRGAPFTFNAARFARELAEARARGQGSFPSFDHGIGDPREGDIRLDRQRHKLVIVEGNYLLLDEPPWNAVREILDETWFLDVDIKVCKERVRQRFLDTGRDEATAQFRVDYNDGPNAELVCRVSPGNADRVIRLVEC